MIVTAWLTNHGNDRQRCVDDFWSCECDNPTEDMVAVTPDQSIGRVQGLKCWGRHHYHIFKMSVDGSSMIPVLASWIIKQQCDNIKLKSKFWPPLGDKMAPTIAQPPPKSDCQRTVNDLWSCIMDIQSAVH